MVAATPLYMEIMTEIFVVYTNGITKISSPQVHENMVQLCIERSSSPKKSHGFKRREIQHDAIGDFSIFSTSCQLHLGIVG